MLRAPSPPGGNAAENPPGLDPGDIELLLQMPDPDGDHNLLEGVITQLCLEQFSGDSLVQVKVGPLNLMVRLEKEQLRQQPVYPGMNVWLRFNETAVKWV